MMTTNNTLSTAFELAENLSSTDVKENFIDFIHFCAELKLKPHLYASEKMNIKYKGKMIVRFDPSCLDGNLHIFFTVVNSFDQLESLLSTQSADIQAFFLENNRRCGRTVCIQCKPNPKRICRLLGAEHEICWNEMLFTNPTKEQFEYIKKFVEIRKNHIQTLG